MTGAESDLACSSWPVMLELLDHLRIKLIHNRLVAVPDLHYASA